MIIYMIKLFVEFIGSFIFFTVILQFGAPIPIGVALAAVIFFGAAISGGHFNPGVSLSMYLHGKLPLLDLFQYVAVQCLAAVAAVYFIKFIPITKQTNTL